MPQISIRLSDPDYRLIAHRAHKKGCTVSNEVRALIQSGLLLDVPERIQQVQTACALEAVILLRKLAELRDRQLVESANKEAKTWMDSLFTTERV